MATIKYFPQSEKETANIFVRYSIGRDINLKRKTGFITRTEDWPKINSNKTLRDERLKSIRVKLDDLKAFLENAYNDAVRNGTKLTGKWLQEQIDIFNGKKPGIELDLLTNCIDKYIQDAPYKLNQKKELGLCAGRINQIKGFKQKILQFESDVLDGKHILVRDVNLNLAESFKRWMFDQSYSIDYVGKQLSNLKAVCNEAGRLNIETSSQVKSIRSISQRKSAEEIIYLSEEELELIKLTPLMRKALLNARTWLLLGCLLGQRASDLLRITQKNIKQLNGMTVIELKQIKTGKLVAIPLLPEAKEIVDAGLPYKISLGKFNEYLKEICQIAGLDELMPGKKKSANGKPSLKGLFPKYELVSSHVCRRSFASNFYGRIPTSVLMNITAHGSEQIFLRYIGKSTYDNAYSMLEYFSKLQPRENFARLEVVRTINSTG